MKRLSNIKCFSLGVVVGVLVSALTATAIVVSGVIVLRSSIETAYRLQIDAAEEERDALKEQIIEKELSNAAREYEIENSSDDDIIADIARDLLGLDRSGESVFYDTED